MATVKFKNIWKTYLVVYTVYESKKKYNIINTIYDNKGNAKITHLFLTPIRKYVTDGKIRRVVQSSVSHGCVFCDTE